MRIQNIQQTQQNRISYNNRPQAFGYKISGLDEILREDLQEAVANNTLPKISHGLRKLLVKFQKDPKTVNEIIHYDSSGTIQYFAPNSQKVIKELDYSKGDMTNAKIVREVIDAIEGIEARKARRAERIALIHRADAELLDNFNSKVVISTKQGETSELKSRKRPSALVRV